MSSSPLPATTPASAVIREGIQDILPLGIAVIPWGILCGSLAVSTGFTPLQAQALSLLVFAGAAQLAGIPLMAGSPSVLLSSTFVISSRHLLYSAAFREQVINQPLRWRLLLAFVLTDEMFAVSVSHQLKYGYFSRLYALVSGFGFYLIWNLATLTGIITGEYLLAFGDIGFEFAVAATFIALVIPTVRQRSTVLAIIVSGVTALLCSRWQISNGLIFATFAGMLAGYLSSASEQENDT